LPRSLKMNLIDRLKCCEEMNQSIRPIFARFGATAWQTFSTPLVKLSESEVMALLMNWVTKIPFKGDTVKIRLRDVTDQEVYEIWLTKSFREGTKITKMRKCEHLKTKMSYDWTSKTTYNNLTRTKLDCSMERANQMNKT